MKNILLISLNALGDTYLTLSSVAPFRKYFKNINVDLLSTNESSLFSEYFGLNKLFYITRSRPLSFLKSLHIIRKKYDFVISFFPGRLNSLYTNISRADNKYYYRNYRKLDFWHNSSQELFKNNKKTGLTWMPRDNYMFRIELILKNIVEDKIILEKPLFSDIRIDINRKENYVVLNHSSRDINRQINRGLLIEIGKYYENRGIKMLILDFYKEFENDPELGKYSVNILEFKKVVDLILNSRLFITADSFLIHVADAYKVNSFGIFSNTNPDCVLFNSSFKVYTRYPISSIKFDDIKSYLEI
jgi:ADP-heptose:LPS heptosyltransferase